MRKQAFINFKKEVGADDDIYIEGYANKNIIDSVGDRMVPEGMVLDRYKLNPIILVNHDPEKIMGTCEKIEPTEKGIYIRAKLLKSDAPMVKYYRDCVKQGALRAFSISFDPLNGYAEEDSYVYDKYRINEVSMVSLPCNMESVFTQAKCKTLKTLQEKHDNLIKKGDFDKALTVLKEMNEEMDEKPSEDSPKSDMPDDNPSDSEPEKPKADGFRECVSAKIPKLIAEGKPQDQAIAMAIAMCQADGKCDLSSLTPDNLEFARSFAEKEYMDDNNRIEPQNPEGTGGEGEPPKPPMTPTPSSEQESIPVADLLKTQTALFGEMLNVMRSIQEMLGQNMQNIDTSKSKSVASKDENDDVKTQEYTKNIDSVLKRFGY